MSAPAATDALYARNIIRLLKKKWALWVLPTIAMTIAAGAYSVVRTPVWKASQAILVRDEAVGSRQGRFDSADAMKTAQETIMEVSKNRQVLASALESVNGRKPTKEEVGKLKDALAINAPKGAEFGRTEVIYLSVKADTREAALQLTDAVCTQLGLRLQELRRRKAQSVISELEKTVHLTQLDLAAASKKLSAIESEVGSDLGELRILNDTGAGDSNLRLALNEIKNELRQAVARQQDYEQLRQILTTAIADPSQIVAAPNQLLNTLPTLRRLKTGLVDAQLRTAQLLGKMNSAHPLVKASFEEEREVKENLRAELAVAGRDLSAQLRISEARIRSLEKQRTEVRNRLGRLAGLRAGYNVLNADVRQRIAIVEQANKDLADARASQNAATASSLLTRLDSPIADDSPVGPSKAVILLGGFLGGLALGLGLVTLTSPLGVQSGRRLTDYLGFGRRASDRPGTRATDNAAPAGNDRRTQRRLSEAHARRSNEGAPQRRSSSAAASADANQPATPSIEQPEPNVRSARAFAENTPADENGQQLAAALLGSAFVETTDSDNAQLETSYVESNAPFGKTTSPELTAGRPAEQRKLTLAQSLARLHEIRS